MNEKANGHLVGSLAVSWAGTVTNWASQAGSVFGALAAMASLVASCYAIAIARRKLGTDLKRKGHKGLERRKRRNGRVARGFGVLLIAAFLGQGCTFQAKRLARERVVFEKHAARLQEESRALTTGVVDALQLAPKSPETELAKSLAVVDQEIEGLPLKRLPVVEALKGETNAVVEIDARVKEVEGMRVEKAALQEKLRATESELMEMGTKYELARNRKIAWWSRFSMGGLGLIGAVVALCVFCPVALPLIGRLLGWVVGKIPSLAGALGVVGKDAFDAVVRGVGAAREALRKEHAEALATVDSNLKVETDREHKALIEQRRAALQV